MSVDEIVTELREIVRLELPEVDFSRVTELRHLVRDARVDGEDVEEATQLLEAIVLGVDVPVPTRQPQWRFYASDDDRSNGWTNHGFSLQFVCEGYGNTADEAWAEAKAAGRVPALDDLRMDGSPILVDADYAIRADHELNGGWPA